MVVTTATTGASKQEAAVAFVRFHDEIFAFAELGGGAGLIDAAADDESGIKMRSGQNGRNDGGGGGFSVGAGDGDAVFQAHQFREHFRARDHRNFHFVRFDDFGIAGGDGGGSDHHVSAVDVDGFVGVENRGAKFGEAFGDRRRLAVGAGNGVAESEQHFGDAAHADAADAHQVDALKIAEADHHGATFSVA